MVLACAAGVLAAPALAALGRTGRFVAAWAGVDRDDRERQELYARAIRS